MKKTCISLTIAALVAIASTASLAAGNMTREDYSAAREKIRTDCQAGKASCKGLAGNAKDISVEEAKGNEKVAKAELEFRYTGKQKAEYDFRIAKAEAIYDVAKEKCDDKIGNEKDVCVKAAKADLTKSKADAKLGKIVANATRDTIDDKLDADYKVAAEKCDVLAGDAKRSCISATKAKYGRKA